MFIAILGRQPEISLAELGRIHGDAQLRQLSVNVATISASEFDFERLGGSPKAGRVELTINSTNWREVADEVISHYLAKWSVAGHKITLGISAYDIPITPRNLQSLGLGLKSKLKQSGTSLRLVPNKTSALSTATSHHNKLGLSPNKVELLIVRDKGKTLVAESLGTQNITAIAARDQARPATSARVGMLPPKLARIMINLATGSQPSGSLLDPFCGTGVVLQEALLLGLEAHGSDLSSQMVDYSQRNLDWLRDRYHHLGRPNLEVADATNHTWAPTPDYIVSEIYLGKPFASLPPRARIELEQRDCDRLLMDLLTNLSRQLKPSTRLCLAVPAWQIAPGQLLTLPITRKLEALGYRWLIDSSKDLAYCRENQVVARHLLVLEKS